MELPYIYGLKIFVRDAEKSADWLCQNLFFEKERGAEYVKLRSGKLHILLFEDKDQQIEAHGADNMFLGFRHIALETYDIQAALKYCLEKRMELQLSENGEVKFNDKVYGTGMLYFNIQTEFGLIIEISQKLHCMKEPFSHLIEGMEHIGIQTEDVCTTVEFYEQLGFHREFQPVVNESNGQRVSCCMVSSGETTLEIYGFESEKKVCCQENPVIDQLLLKTKNLYKGVDEFRGTAGEKIKILPV